jgi:hypothetical protein
MADVGKLAPDRHSAIRAYLSCSGAKKALSFAATQRTLDWRSRKDLWIPNTFSGLDTTQRDFALVGCAFLSEPRHPKSAPASGCLQGEDVTQTNSMTDVHDPCAGQ